jgi:hypothetical protein
VIVATFLTGDALRDGKSMQPSQPRTLSGRATTPRKRRACDRREAKRRVEARRRDGAKRAAPIRHGAFRGRAA